MAHLLRRAGFGGRSIEVDLLATSASWAAVVDRVLDTAANPADTIPAAVDSRAEPYYPAWVAGVHHWMNRMATSPTPIVEKVALFWHGVLASAAYDPLPRLMVRQIATYRRLGLGDVHDLLQAMAIDPAMLVYLNGSTNVAAQPNENFGRELMELFTLGNGAFTEADVIAMSRAWTGHNLNKTTEQYEFRAQHHDNGDKTLFGITRNWDGPAALTEIVRGTRQRDCARYLAGRLWSFFAFPNPDAALLTELTDAFIAGGMNVKALLRVIFLRPEFRWQTTRHALVRSPIEWQVAAMRSVGRTSQQLNPQWWMEPLGQELYRPPNVSGWRQNGAWISSTAQWAKASFAGYVRWQSAEAGVLAETETMSATAAVAAAFKRFGIDEPSPQTTQALTAWASREIAARRTWVLPSGLIHLTLLTPDFQLA